AAVITGDNDFVPAIETARAEGVLVWLFHEEGQHTSNELMQAADERIEIDRDFLQRVSRKKLNER
ncbi:MAG: NYN domain-containing protein, partial [Anaerolineaceae bacterium]|nr:NYN domain-containing protein [Anaerolineaceae bacterium]